MLLPPPGPEVVFPLFILICFLFTFKFWLGCLERTLHLRETLIFLETCVHSKQLLLYSFTWPQSPPLFCLPFLFLESSLLPACPVRLKTQPNAI